ncbi:MAG: hypothetical protein HY556_02625 [Euryarchaeota archaeon]|nr:hypothetical protein [Euryarchaeota archaeon]
MSEIIEKHLASALNHEILVVMSDDRSFKGTLMEFDNDWIVLHDVTEGSSQNLRGWEEPAISAGVIEKYITWKGIISEEKDKTKIYRLRDVLLHMDGILRVWLLKPELLGKPEHVHIESGSNAPSMDDRQRPRVAK